MINSEESKPVNPFAAILGGNKAIKPFPSLESNEELTQDPKNHKPSGDRPEIESHYSRSRLSSMEMDEFYDEFEHPPDLKECDLHGKAMQIGFRQPLKDAKD